MKRKGIVAVNCSRFGASSVYGIDNDPEGGESLLIKQSMIAPYGWETLIHDQDRTFDLPYRVDLACPRPIKRVSPPHALLECVSAKQEYDAWEDDYIVKCSNAVSFLMHQTAKAAIHRGGVVVPDQLTHEAAESFLKKSRLPRNRLVLLPWPIAAAWAWIDVHAAAIASALPLDLKEAGTILCVQIGQKEIASVPIHLVESDANKDYNFIPARNRDHHNLTISDAGINVDEISSHIYNEASALPDCIGIVVCGRSRPSAEIRLIESRVLNYCIEQKLRYVCESDCEYDLLTNGALLATTVVSRGGVPYYETIPHIELLVNRRLLGPRDNPSSFKNEHGWLDCLAGMSGAIVIAGGTMIPANKSFKHRPDYPNLKLSKDKTEVRIAFDLRDVRHISAETYSATPSRESIKLQVEYQLGSGRPIVTIERGKHPDDPIVFQWDQAEEDVRLRDEVTKYTAEDLDRLCDEREKWRQQLGRNQSQK